MKRADYVRRVNEIVARLSELSSEDRKVLQPRGSLPVLVSSQMALGFEARNVERQKLHNELKKLASEPLEF
jgi:hypothetical protein